MESKHRNIVTPTEFEGIDDLVLTNGGCGLDGLGSTINDYELREDFRGSVSWHIPTRSLLKTLVKYSPIVSIGSGYAYSESEAIKIGADIIATDITPDNKNKWCKKGKFFMEVERLTALQSVKRYKDRNVFLAWPPYSGKMASQVARFMKSGKHLIYVGEGNGGCTGDDMFFECLDKDFKELKINARIYSFWGLHDFLRVFKKIQ